MHIFPPVTDICPSWISRRRRMTQKRFHNQSLGFKVMTKGSAVRHVADCSIAPAIQEVNTGFIHLELTKIPWLFPDIWQYQSREFYELSKKNISGPNILASSGWNVKFPDISLTFLQSFIFPWHITEFPDNSLTLKKNKFPWHFPDAIATDKRGIHIIFFLFLHENMLGVLIRSALARCF